MYGRWPGPRRGQIDACSKSLSRCDMNWAALLELLMRNAGRVLPRKLIEEKLYTWDDDVSSNAVEVHVHHLRRKLGSEFIRTVHGIGYTLGDA